MFEILVRRLRFVTDVCEQQQPAGAELTHAAARLGDIFRQQWQLCLGAPHDERAAFAAQCAHVNVRAALMNVFITCVKILYEERRGLQCIANSGQSRAERNVAWIANRNALAARAFREHQSALIRSIRGSNGSSSRDSRAEDVVQEVFVRWLLVDNADEIEAPKNYLSTIARRVMHEVRKSDYYERRAVIIDSEVVADLLRANADGFSERFDERLHAIQLLKQLLATLPLLHRQILLLHNYFGLSYSEVAGTLGCSKHTVKKYLLESMQRMRSVLDSLGEDSGHASPRRGSQQGHSASGTQVGT